MPRHCLRSVTDCPTHRGEFAHGGQPTPTLRKLVRDGHVGVPVTIHDSWTGKANEPLFKPFYAAAIR